MRPNDHCTVCGAKGVVAHGFCNAHYLRFKVYGHPKSDMPLKMKAGPCKIPGCKRAYGGLGFCKLHHGRLKTWGHPGADVPVQVRDGSTKKLEYGSWRAMLDRCHNPNATKFHAYGARGITVCARWRDFRKFFKDMGPKPTPKHSIDRKNNYKGYTKANCRWATIQEQAQNRRGKNGNSKRSKTAL